MVFYEEFRKLNKQYSQPTLMHNLPNFWFILFITGLLSFLLLNNIYIKHENLSTGVSGKCENGEIRRDVSNPEYECNVFCSSNFGEKIKSLVSCTHLDQTYITCECKGTLFNSYIKPLFKI